MVLPIVPAFGMTGGIGSCWPYFGIVVGSSVPPGTWAIAIVTLATISASADDTERVRFHQVPFMIFLLLLFFVACLRLTSVSFSRFRYRSFLLFTLASGLRARIALEYCAFFHKESRLVRCGWQGGKSRVWERENPGSQRSPVRAIQMIWSALSARAS